MNQRLRDVLSNQEANYLLPFYWQHGNHYDRIPAQVAAIAASGARAFCVESRPHKDFCGEGWWRDMDLILAEAGKRDMKVWVLDDNHFPTGNANGRIASHHPELRKWQLVERHVDVMGPMRDATILMDTPNPDHQLLGVFAYPRTGQGESIAPEPVELTANAKPPFLRWSIPAGCHRIFFLYKSRQGTLPGQQAYIDLLNPDSVRVLIEAVYEPHYEHYAAQFGKTLAGFFSDEPSFGNCWAGPHANDYGMYNRRVGMNGLALPWNDRLVQVVGRANLPALWYDMGEATPRIRHAYMDTVTTLYRDCFTRQLGDWCRAHDVEYIGHIIEDMNAHARLGHGAGHFFRALDGQDMGGMDVVLHQVMPGFADYPHTASCFGGMADPEFFQYVVPKLAASHSHIDKRMRGRAMCEEFGAFGWAEGAPFMKWITDFLLVRGINHFVPHAFSPAYPDPDCPPHFGAEGHDPQFDGFAALMTYTNKVSHLLCGGLHCPDAAILYHAEAEWMNRDGGYMLTQKPSKLLYDAHLDYDILPGDFFTDGSYLDCAETYPCLVVPFAELLPAKLLNALEQADRHGIKVIFVDARPAGCGEFGTVATLAELPSLIPGHLRFKGDCHLLRHYCVQRDDATIVMLFNESLLGDAAAEIALPCSGDYVSLDLLNDTCTKSSTTDGKVAVHLQPYQSRILVFGNLAGIDLPRETSWQEAGSIAPVFQVAIAHSENLADFQPYRTTGELFDLGAPDELPDFAGIARYQGTFRLDKAGSLALDLGRVGQTARVALNGADLGIRICPPYRFDLSSAARKGDNEIVIEVANTLACKVRDRFSQYIQIPPSGLLGPLTLYRS
ncbi:MAG: glycosyl transferase family 2 [Lentisphaeria bacterium]|jgi:hypothetical protein|nr:glycosyl transferase family 2 [Lentisphaeria bacterium]